MISYLPNPTVEKVHQGQFIGEGIKKTPAFDVLLTKKEHEKWKKDFWGKSL